MKNFLNILLTLGALWVWIPVLGWRLVIRLLEVSDELYVNWKGLQ